MKKRKKPVSQAVPKKYVGSAIVLLDPDVARAFPDAESVNRALRAIMEIAPRVRKRRSS